MQDPGSASRPWDAVPFFRRAPLVPAALVLCVGVTIGLRFPSPVIPWFVWIVPATAGVWATQGGKRLALACLALFTLGAGNAARDAHQAARLAGMLDRPREQLELIFRITGEPQAASIVQRGEDEWIIPARLVTIHRTTQDQDMEAELAVRLSGKLPEGVFIYGNHIRAHGVLERREGTGAMLWPSDYRFTLFDPADALVTSTGKGNRFVAACIALRARAAHLLQDRETQAGVKSGPEGAVLRALTLGMRGEIHQDINDLFARTGTLHILSVSGLHVVIIGGLLLFFVRWTPLPRPLWGLVVIPALAVFVCATGLKASSLRALLMATAFGIAPLIWRKPDARTSLALSAIVLLLLSPRQLQDVGFQFSYLSMLVLIGLGPAADAWLRKVFEPDPFAEPLHTPRSNLHLRLARLFCSFLAMNAVAWAASAPLTAATFHVWSPVAVLANLLVVPLSTLVCWLGFLALITAVIWPWLGAGLQGLGCWVVKWMLAWADFTRDLPGAWQYVAGPPEWFHVFFMVFLFWLVGRQCFDLRALTAGVLLALGLGGIAWQRQQERDIWILNQDGVATLIGMTSGSRGWVADPGGRFTSQRLLRSLREKGIDHLDIFCSELNTRRAGALPDILNAFRVRKIILPKGENPQSPLLHSLQAGGIPIEFAGRGDRGFTGDLFHEILSPATGTKSSLAARFSREGLGLLWMGGVKADEESSLSDVRINAATPMLVVNTQAGTRSLSEETLQHLAPVGLVVCRSDFPETRRFQQPMVDRWLREDWLGLLELENGGELRLDLTSPSLNEFLPFSHVRKDQPIAGRN